MSLRGAKKQIVLVISASVWWINSGPAAKLCPVTLTSSWTALRADFHVWR
jgi:hypothetical protein